MSRVRESDEVCRNPLSEEDVKKFLQPEVAKMYKELKKFVYSFDTSETESNLSENLRQKFFIEFADEYTLKLLAKKITYGDAGDLIVEEMPIEDTDSLLEVKLKLLPWWRNDKTTGLPFRVQSINCINEDGELSTTELEESLNPVKKANLKPEVKQQYVTTFTQQTEPKQITLTDLFGF